MTVLPFMHWYPADYAGDTRHLTRDQDGAYRLLLDAMWLRGGKLPNDPVQLARIAKCTVDEWKNLWDVIGPFFHRNSRGFLVQKRLVKELKKALHIQDVRSKAGSKGGSKTQAKFKQTPSKGQARARVPEPEPDKITLKGRRLRPGASARQRAGGALAPAPAGEAPKPPAATVGGFRTVGRALPRELRTPPPETSQENPGNGFAAANDREAQRQRAYDFAAQRYPDAQKRVVFLGLSGADPEHDAEWWLDTLGEQMEREQWSDPE